MTKSQVDLSIEFCNLAFENPFMLSSAPPTATGEMIRRAFEAGWGGAVVKTLGLTPTPNVRPRFATLETDNKRLMGFENIELCTDRPLSYWTSEIKKIKKEHPKKILFVSIFGSNMKSWQESACRVQDAGADGLELNVSCPMMIGATEGGWGAAVGQSPELTLSVTKWVKEVSSVPVMVKMTPNVTDIATIAKAAEKGGADALSGINTVSGFMGVDLETFEPRPSVNGKGALGGYSGPAIKPIALRCVVQMAKNTNLPISGIGGIFDWQDAVQFLMVGASTTQLCTAVMYNGFRIIKDLKAGLSNYLADKGFSSVRDIVGITLPKISLHEDLDRTYRVFPEIDKKKCVACGLCYLACKDAGYQAIELNEERRPKVDTDKCDGCSLCYYRCPVLGCISLKKTENFPKPRIIES